MEGKNERRLRIKEEMGRKFNHFSGKGKESVLSVNLMILNTLLLHFEFKNVHINNTSDIYITHKG